jgi:hypothetical protein
MSRIITTVLSLIALVLAGCPPPLALTIYNNTGADLTILVDARRIGWQDATTLRIAADAELKWADLDWEEDPRRQGKAPVLVVESRAGVSRYRLAIPGLPGEYVDSRTGVKQRFLQLERDARLYAIKAEMAFPAAPLPPQPSGMPIEPDAG